MFIQAAVLLLLAHVFSVETFKVEDHHKDFGIQRVDNPKKTHEILKNVGKRYFPIRLKPRKKVPDFEDYTPDLEYRNPSWSNLPFDTKFREWDLTSDEIVAKRRNSVARTFVQSLVSSSSLKNELDFVIGMNTLRLVLDPDFFAEICDDGKQLNPYQYMKFVTQSANLYQSNHKSIKHKLLETNRRSLHVKTDKFVTFDNNGLKVEFEYEFKAKLTFSSGFYFSLIYLKQGGSCAHEGTSNMELGDGVRDIVAEELEGLKTAPTIKLFFDLFTPTIYKDTEEDPEYLPHHWLSGLNSSVVQIDVCQDEVAEAVKYTVDEFLIWYDKFDIMWHRKAMITPEQVDVVQILELTDESISARVTFKLQMGTDPKEELEDWNFKFTGKKIDGVWFLTTVTALCNPVVKYKDQSFKHVRDVIAANFVQELGYLNDTQWSFTPEFIRKFIKRGNNVEVTYCKEGVLTPIKQVDLFNKDKANSHGIKFTKYSLEREEIPSPTPDKHIYRFDTIGVPADSTSKEEKKYQWSYELQWDQKDQFYYIFRFGIGCAAPLSVDEIYEVISFHGQKTRAPHIYIRFRK